MLEFKFAFCCMKILNKMLLKMKSNLPSAPNLDGIKQSPLHLQHPFVAGRC